MTINGLDISSYQEQPAYGKLIDWTALKADPFNFRFIWIKCAEGTDSTGYVKDATRQAAGAKSVKFEAVNPYHFYYFQWFSTAANRWYTLNAADQARAFRNAAQDAGMLICHPMTDIEDPFVGQFLVWSDTATADKALAFARRLNAHLKAYHEAVEFEFGVKPDIYTGAWWWDRMGVLLLANYPAECEWWGAYRFILADYVGGLDYPGGIAADQVIAWQFTSTPTPPVQGIPTGHVVPGDALDCDRWMLSETEFLKWTGQNGGNTMAGIYKTDVPLEDRAWVMEYRPDEKWTTAPTPDNPGVDAVILPMINMPWDGSHTRILVEPTFASRFTELGNIPVIAKVNVDAGFITTEGHQEQEVDGHTVWQNWVVTKMLDALHIGPWTQGNLNPADFRQIKAIIFEQTTEMDHQNPPREIGAFWQTKFFRYIVNHWRVLVQAGAVPNVPLLLKSNPEWLEKYQVWTGCADWLYLDISQPQLESTASYPDLWSIYKFAVWNDFKYSFIPEGYEKRVMLFEFSNGKQRLSFLTGNNLAYLSKAFDNAAGLSAFLNTAPPPPPPPVDNCDSLRLRVVELENQIGQMNNIISDQGVQIAELKQQVALAESVNVQWQTWYAGAPRGGIS